MTQWSFHDSLIRRIYITRERTLFTMDDLVDYYWERRYLLGPGSRRRNIAWLCIGFDESSLRYERHHIVSHLSDTMYQSIYPRSCGRSTHRRCSIQQSWCIIATFEIDDTSLKVFLCICRCRSCIMDREEHMLCSDQSCSNDCGQDDRSRRFFWRYCFCLCIHDATTSR